SAAAKPGPMEVIQADVVSQGRKVAALSLTMRRPSLTALLPQFIALTFTLLMGGIGVAIFLARGMAHQVIKPVQHLSQAMHEVAGGGSFEPIEVKAQDELFRGLT